MVKFENSLLSTLAPNEGCSFSWGRNSIVSMAECRLDEEDSWVVVKKQRITILIPPASPTQHQIEGPRTEQIQSKTKKTTKKRSHTSSKRHLRHFKGGKNSSRSHFELEPQIKKNGIKALETRQAPRCTPRPNARILPSSYKANQVPIHNVRESTLDVPSQVYNVGKNAVFNGNCICPMIRFSRTVGDGPRPLIGALQVVNQRIKASNLEKKLARLGGLRRWLATCGLDQFIQVLERESFDKFQLVNLTMGKLKDMGADAVGPRRKLLHAIDCLCQPYYFKAM